MKWGDNFGLNWDTNFNCGNSNTVRHYQICILCVVNHSKTYKYCYDLDNLSNGYEITHTYAGFHNNITEM